MSYAIVVLVSLILTGAMGYHIFNEVNFSKKIVIVGETIKRLLKEKHQIHVELVSEFKKSSDANKLRIMEHYMQILDPEFAPNLQDCEKNKRLIFIEDHLESLYSQQDLDLADIRKA